MQRTAEIIFIISALPKILPSCPGSSTNSLTSVFRNPICIIGVTNAATDAA